MNRDLHGQTQMEDVEVSVIEDIGARVRRLRKARGLSLSEVATRAGLSSGFLSQLERGISAGSIRAVAQIAEALDVSLGDIFHSAAKDRTGFAVTRAEHRKTIEFPEALASKDMLTSVKVEPQLNMYILTMEPGGRSGSEPFSHKGVESGYILAGAIELTVDGRKEILSTGDSFVFESRLPHSYRNAGQVDLRAIWVNYAAD